jgi:hypothetical protein
MDLSSGSAFHLTRQRAGGTDECPRKVKWGSQTLRRNVDIRSKGEAGVTDVTAVHCIQLIVANPVSTA